MVELKVRNIVSLRTDKRTMIHLEVEEEEVMQDKKNMIICPVHGEYPESLKAFGCPDCAEDDLDEVEVEDWHNRQSRKTISRER